MSRREKDAEDRILGAAEGFAILALVALALAFVILCGGCRNTGTYAVVGDLDAPVDISDASDTINVRALFSLRGAKVWSAKDSRVVMNYTNNYTNAYLFGMVETKGRQDFGVKVIPTTDEAETTDRGGETDAEEPPPVAPAVVQRAERAE